MPTPFDEHLALKQAARKSRAGLSWEEKVHLIERMKQQLNSWKKPSKSSIASKPQV
ncbi:MAG: hypothetical protein NTV46_20305 [Verrucomicrobia bacterium]|nr:hypothetical protein [Verrucomicrobiota bacterium]